jgi:hypothetical protein
MIALELYSSERPERVLRALRTHAGQWREAQIPVELQRSGIRSVEAEVEGTTCELRYDRRWYGALAPGQYLRGRATVTAAGEGSRVDVTVDYRLRNLAVSTLGLVVTSVFAVGLVGPSGLLLPVMLCVPVGLHYLWLRERSRRLERNSNDLADYLVRRIEAAVGDASRADVVAHAS